MQKRGKDIHKLRVVTTMLINEQPLLERHHNHPLHGGVWEGKWECHVESDWLLVYRIDEQNRRVLFTAQALTPICFEPCPAPKNAVYCSVWNNLTG